MHSDNEQNNHEITVHLTMEEIRLAIEMYVERRHYGRVRFKQFNMGQYGLESWVNGAEVTVEKS